MANKLEVSLQLVDKLTSPLNRAAQDINGITKRIEGAFKFVTAAGAVTGLAVSLGAVINKSIEFGDRIDGLSKTLRMNAEQVQQWDVVLGNNKSSIDEQAAGFQNLNKMAYAAAIGQKKSALIFEQLGVEVKDSNGAMRDQGELLNDTIYKLADVKDKTLQSALAQRLFGTAGANLIPILSQGSEAIKEQLEQSKEYGFITGATAEKLADAKDKMDHFKRSTAAISAEFTAVFIPAISKGSEALAKAIAHIGRFLNTPVVNSANKKILSDLQNDAKNLRWEIELLEQAGKSKGINGFADPERLRVARAELRLVEEDIKRITGEMNKSNFSAPADSILGGTGKDKGAKKEKNTFNDWLTKRMEDLSAAKQRERDVLLDDIVKKQNEEERFQLWLANKANEISEQKIKAQKEENERLNEEREKAYQSNITSGQRLAGALSNFTNMTNSLTEARINKMRKEGTLSDAAEKDFRERMKKRQVVIGTIAIAESALAGILAVKEAWATGPGGFFTKLATSAVAVLEVATVTGTQIAAIKSASFAGGVKNYSGGWALVGEQGPEMRYIPPQSSVYTAHETNQMMNQPSQSLHLTVYDRNGNVTKEVETALRSGEFNNALSMIKRKIA